MLASELEKDSESPNCHRVAYSPVTRTATKRPAAESINRVCSRLFIHLIVTVMRNVNANTFCVYRLLPCGIPM
jgi:hypothetical protein